MADSNLTANRATIPDLFEHPRSLERLLETAFNQVLDAHMSDHLAADRYEHKDERKGYRNGYRDRHLAIRIGPLTQRVPQTRDGSFATDVFERYSRSEQAFVIGLMQIVVNGVPTRKVTQITEGLCGTASSKATVSRLTYALDVSVGAFLSRALESEYLYHRRCLIQQNANPQACR